MADQQPKAPVQSGPNEHAKKYELPVPGTKFYYKGQEVNLATITEEQAARLAADPLCKFIKPKGAATAPPAPKA